MASMGNIATVVDMEQATRGGQATNFMNFEFGLWTRDSGLDTWI